jgi:hypothetical protein
VCCGEYQKKWHNGCLPIGPEEDPAKYRGISLISMVERFISSLMRGRIGVSADKRVKQSQAATKVAYETSGRIANHPIWRPPSPPRGAQRDQRRGERRREPRGVGGALRGVPAAEDERQAAAPRPHRGDHHAGAHGPPGRDVPAPPARRGGAGVGGGTS